MRRFFLLLIILFVTGIPAMAEDKKPSPLSFTAAYYGEMITHGGMTLGIEYSFLGNSWYELYGNAELGFFLHQRNNFSFFATLGLGNRFTAPFGLYGEILINAGYMLITTDGDVYTRADDGSVQNTGKDSRSALKLDLMVGIGWDFEKKNINLPLKIFFRAGIMAQYPYNNYMLFTPAIQTGVIFRF